MKNSRVIKKCLCCGKEFWVKFYRKNTAKYCSLSCRSKIIAFKNFKNRNGFGFKKGHIPWNNGLTKEVDGKLRYLSEFRKTNKEIQNRLRKKDKNHFNWKGDDVGYRGLHIWVQNRLGIPNNCEYCGKIGLKGRQIHWANKGHKYLRNLTDWIRLCIKCHKALDAGKISIYSH